MCAGVLATAGVPPLVRAATADAGCELVKVITKAGMTVERTGDHALELVTEG